MDPRKQRPGEREREDQEKERDDQKQEREDWEREREDQERSCIHERVLHLETGADALKDKRCQMAVEMQQYIENKSSKALVKLLAGQLEEVKKETCNKEMELSLHVDKLTDNMTGTPKCHNTTGCRHLPSKQAIGVFLTWYCEPFLPFIKQHAGFYFLI